jgi:hypothetical protein
VRPLVLVDGENVRRSAWPNVGPRSLLQRARRWAEAEGVDLLVVFDGAAPETADDVRGAPSADDEIVRIAARTDRDYWLVTSDRELRARAGARAVRVVGGGRFLSLL